MPSVIQCVLKGLGDSLRFHRAIILMIISQTIRKEINKCVILNLVIFAGFVTFSNYLILPAVEHFLTFLFSGDVQVIAFWIRLVYQILFIYPIYMVSFILNSVWYQRIANHAMARVNRNAGGNAADRFSVEILLRRLADSAYYFILSLAYLLQIQMFNLIPFLGQIISAAAMALLNSLYCFEYRWIREGRTTEQRIDIIEGNWPYFLGFGAWSVLLSYVFPKFISHGICAVLFPMNIMLAVTSNPTVPNAYFPKFRIFFFARKISVFSLKFYKFIRKFF